MHLIQQRLIAEVIDREGGYVDHPADRGGPTRYGITQEVARQRGEHTWREGVPMPDEPDSANS